MSEAKKQTPQKRLSAIKKLGNTTTAINRIKELLVDFPDFIPGWLELGLIYRRLGDRPSALNTFTEAIKLKPNHRNLRFELFTEQLHLNKFVECRQNIQELLEIYPEDVSILIRLGKLERKEKNRHKALEIFQQAAQLKPEKIWAHIQTARELQYFQKFDEAEQQLKTALEYHPNHFNILMQLGDLDRKRGHREKALHWFNLAQEKYTNPSQNLEAQILATEELRELGRLDEALKLIDKTIEEFPDNLRPQMVKGNILQKQPNLIAATYLYKQIIATQPNHLNSRLELAKVYSQSGQVETAINLLEETEVVLGSNITVLLKLGSLYQSLDDWKTARQWYQKAYQEYPDNPETYCSLANLMFLEGEKEAAIKLLEEAQLKISNSLPIILKLANLQMRLGNLELSHKTLLEILNTFPHKIQIVFQLCRLHMAKGDYKEALEVLERISTDNQEQIHQTASIKANIYFYQYDYQKAEAYFRKSISLAPVATQDRNRLATILMLTGRINEARQQLQIATEELHLKTSPGKTAVPLKSHPAMVTNELRMNPELMAKLQAAQQQTGQERILKLGSLITEEPTYLGTTLYLARELREQGIFDTIQQALSQNKTKITSIPKRIVQFWDELKPPPEVQSICQSWIDLNPGYKYTRFNLETAVAFLQEHYDEKVMKAFANCDQPATQADFFRLAYLNTMGGFYADADDLCRQSLNTLVDLNPELVVLQEDFACIGNNFIGCVPGQNMIRIAFYQAVNNLLHYCNESPWFKTGPGLLTSAIASSLVPYLTYTDYQMWPRLLVLSQSQLRKIVNQHLSLAYKRTNKSWSLNAYQRRIKLKNIS